MFAQEPEYREAAAQQGDGIHSLLRRYDLDSAHFFHRFLEINSSKLDSTRSLVVGEMYYLPIELEIPEEEETPVNDSVVDVVVAVDSVVKEIDTAQLMLAIDSVSSDTIVALDTAGKETKTFPIFGKEYEEIDFLDEDLKGAIYYIVAGHGGPDPGAIGKRDNHAMCEDEYAYDISLRLARELLRHSATVYMIIRDTNDGIRNEAYLDCDKDEICLGGKAIPLSQKERLRQRVKVVNGLYKNMAKRNFNASLYCM